MKTRALAGVRPGLRGRGWRAGADKDEKLAGKSRTAKEQAVAPKYALSDQYYKTTLPFDGGKARCLV
ncbi:CamS family sex pheromone protein, partial [Bacillus cereus]|nr:CamS family sex pheromone protein [Bacillus cereus]